MTFVGHRCPGTWGSTPTARGTPSTPVQNQGDMFASQVLRKQHPSEARASSDTPRREVEATPMPLSSRSASTPKVQWWEGNKPMGIVPILCKPTFVFLPLLTRR